MIEARELTRDFGPVRAVDSVSFTVRPGEVVGLLGPNGAGKTTVFRMLTGSLGPTEGSVRLFGHDLAQAPGPAKRTLGYMPESSPLYPEMTPEEYLCFRAELAGERRFGARKKRALAVAEQAGISSVLGRRIAHLSKGYRQRVALAAALVSEPLAVLLDEPTAGLDPNQIVEFRRLVRELASERAVLLSTHVLSEVEATCDRALVLASGRLVASGTLAELRVGRDSARFSLRLGAKKEEVENALGSPEASASTALASDGEATLLELVGDDATFAATLARLVNANVGVLSVEKQRTPLDDVFHRLTSAALAPAETPHSRVLPEERDA